MGEIVTALADAGLRLEYLYEFPFCAWQRLKPMERGGDGYWRLPGAESRVPFLFSVKATKPER